MTPNYIDTPPRPAFRTACLPPFERGRERDNEIRNYKIIKRHNNKKYV